jgi:prophage regulatory protein
MESNGNQLLRIQEVSQLTSLAKSTINLWVAQGNFPKPSLLSPTLKVWRMIDIDEWINNHFETKDAA